MTRKTSGSRTGRATRDAAPEASSSSSSSDRTIAAVVPSGDRRASLEAIRDRLALETEDTLWMRHKAECHCVCGMGDGRLLAALVKELRAVMTELAALPNGSEVSKSDDLAARRAARISKAASQ